MQHLRHAGISALILSVAGVLFAGGAASALTYTVTSLADDGGAGELRAGISAANSSAGSTITFQKGLTGKILLSPTLQALPTLLVSTTIQGPGASLIAVDGRGTYRPFHIDAPNSTVTLSGLTIQNGMDAGGTGGAGILVTAGSLTLSNTTLSGNIATGNGGAVCNFGTVSLTRCTLTNNRGYNGGGVYNYTYSGSGALVAFTDCTLSGNSATINGGGVCNDTYSGAGARIFLTRTTLSGNRAGNNGGGFYNYTYSGSGGLTVFKNCALTNNRGVYGAGVYNYSYSGGGGASTFTDCTLAANAASGGGGGTYNYTYSGSGGRSVLLDSIVYGNAGGEIFGSIAATYSDIRGGRAGAGNINVDPQFINAGSGNVTLKYTSACIGAGAAAPGVTVDLPGMPRNNPPTIGAYEGGSGLAGHNVLALQNAAAHQVNLWTPTGTSVASLGTISLAPPSGWTVAGVADFNGDGMMDLLFQEPTTGALTVYYLNVAVVTGTAVFPTLGAGWSVVGVGDFNGDGKPDLVFQNKTDYSIAIRYLNGAQDSGGGVTSLQANLGWRVVGTGDINGDGLTDIVFQKGTSLAVWFMNGVHVLASRALPSAPAGWNVAAVTSLYGHVNPDLVLQQPSGGAAQVWELSNITVVGGGDLSVVPGAGWMISGAR